MNINLSRGGDSGEGRISSRAKLTSGQNQTDPLPVTAMKRRLWLWFVLGFVTTFCLVGGLYRMYFMLPSGEAVVSMKLWQYYRWAWPRFELHSGPRPLGPATGTFPNVLVVLLQHIALSAIAGAITAAIAWWIMRRRQSA
jgi:hypothetical protein